MSTSCSKGLFQGSLPFRGETPPGPKLASSLQDGTIDGATPSISSAARQPRISVYCQSQILALGVTGMKRGLVRACERLSPNLVRFGRPTCAQKMSPPGNAVMSLSAPLWTSSMQGTGSRIREDESALDATNRCREGRRLASVNRTLSGSAAAAAAKASFEAIRRRGCIS